MTKEHYFYTKRTKEVKINGCVHKQYEVIKVVYDGYICDAEDRARSYAHKLKIDLAGGYTSINPRSSGYCTILICPKNIKPVSKPYDDVDFMMDFEGGELSNEKIIDGFQRLINNGVVWKLQGCYGRTAKALIEAGHCTNAITSSKDAYNNTVPKYQKII